MKYDQSLQTASVCAPAAAYVELLSRKQAAEYLGVTEQTLAIWKCTGRYNLPCVKIGRLVKYRRTDLNAFINRNATGS